MSKLNKRKDCNGQQTRYKIISESAYEDRHLFKTCSLMAAVGLSLSAVVATMPQTVANVKAASIEAPAAPAVYSDIFAEQETQPYDNQIGNTNLSETTGEAEKFAVITYDQKESAYFDGFVSAVDNDEASEKLEKIITENEQAMQQKISNPSDDGTYVGCNRDGVAMSEKVAPDWLVLDENGIPVNYNYCITGKATAYYSGTHTATGTPVMQGTVAVDPKEIPYGTKLYITSADGSIIYGYSVAEDTGGFAEWEHGATVDLYMRTYEDCCAWGWRDANIYVLE